MSHLLIRFFLHLLLCATAFLPLICCADTLKDVIESKAFKRYKTNNRPQELKSERWLPSKSNLAKLFVEEGGYNYIFEWLNVTASGYKSGKRDGTLQTEYVAAQREFFDSEQRQVSLLVLVPHPKYRDTKEAGLLDHFSRLRPPKLQINYSEELDISGRKATRYERLDGSCSLVLDLAKSSVLEVKTDDCRNRELLSDFAGKLDLERFERKLES